MIFSKCAEMFAESIPAGILQAYALALSSNRTTSAFASIFISALTTGFGSALVSYGEFWPCVASNIVYTDQTSLIPRPSPLAPRWCFKIADMDTSPKKRRETPEFYGFIPPTGRGLIFSLMMINSTAQFLAKIVSMALLGAVSKAWVASFLVGDFVLFILYTISRNDFFYFIPVESYAGSVLASLLIRAVLKVRRAASS